jgi:hypothetical protein
MSDTTNALAYKLKAADLLVASLNALLTLATVLIAGLLAYSSERSAGKWQWLLYVALLLLIISAIGAVVTINSLINKIQREDPDAVRDPEVRKLYVVLGVALVLSIIAGAAFVATAHRGNAARGSETTTVISDAETRVGADEKATVSVTRSSEGKVQRIEINGK